MTLSQNKINMNIADIKNKIKQNPRLKERLHHLMFYNARPRLWVKWFVNPLFIHHGKGSKIRRRNIMNVSPINIFKLGKHSTVEDFCVIDNGVGNITIGHHTRIGLRSTIIGPVQIGDYVILAQNVVLSGLNHIYTDIEHPICLQGVSVKEIIIEDEAWIAANSVITAGVKIGKHSIVASGSVVTKSVPPYTIVGGNHARILKQYDFEKKEWIKVK